MLSPNPIDIVDSKDFKIGYWNRSLLPLFSQLSFENYDLLIDFFERHVGL